MDAIELAIYGLTWGSAGCAAWVAGPVIARGWSGATTTIDRYQTDRVVKAAKTLDDLFVEVKPQSLTMAYRIAPLAAGLLGYLLSDNLIIAGIAALVGLRLPDLWLKQAAVRRKKQFQKQLVDVLFMLSSSLRAGLSLTQAFEMLEAEMGPPASQEFGLMIKAHRVGRPLEEAMQDLNHRMACEEMNLVTTAVIIARSTGGDITRIINQLISTIREKQKLNDKIGTLTLQGKLQAYIMSALPIFFAMSVRSFNESYFEIFFTDPLGQSLLALVVLLWLCGMFLLFKLSKVDV